MDKPLVRYVGQKAMHGRIRHAAINELYVTLVKTLQPVFSTKASGVPRKGLYLTFSHDFASIVPCVSNAIECSALSSPELRPTRTATRGTFHHYNTPLP